MPSAPSDLSHIALTDHRIRRRPGSPADAEPQAGSRRLPLASFYDATTDPNDEEMARDLGVALMELARQGPDPLRVPASRLVAPWLAAAIRAHPDDLDARDSLGVALGLQGRLDEALGTYEGTLQLVPQREVALADAALMARGLGKRDVSLHYWQAAMAVNPWLSRYRYESARLLADRQEWDKVLPECQRVLKYNAAHLQTRILLVEYYLHKGDKERARTEFKVVRALKPPNVDELERRFAGQLGP
jgi:tetratricopeptide (TPR) repeat protein